MDRGTDPALIAEEQPDSDNEALGPVRVSVEAVGQLVVPRHGISPALYLPNLDNLAKATESIRPTLEAFAQVSQQISKMGLRTLGKRIAHWRKIHNALVSKRSKQSHVLLSKFEKFLLREVLNIVRQLQILFELPQIIGTFVQQVFETNSLMHTGPPLFSTGLPIKNLVTTWGRVI